MNQLFALNDQLTSLISTVVPSTVMVSGYSSDLATDAQGSGWIYASNLIVTNHHVVEGLVDPFIVQPVGRSPMNGTLVGSDPSNDIALLRVEGLSGPVLPIETQTPVLGELCIAIGSPHSFKESASLGIISGLSRQLRNPDGSVIEEMLQTDASVNPGNSGGPLVNVHGRLVGMNTRGPAETVNFAVPAETIGFVVPELAKHGSILRASIGISISVKQDVDGDEPKQAIVVRKVRDPDSPLKPGDVLVAINDVSIRRRIDVIRALNRDVVDTIATVRIKRAQQHQTVQVTGKRRK